MGKIYLNGQIMEAQDARIPVSDSGFLYGAGLFETLRASQGKVFCLGDHLDRLFFSASKLGFNLSTDKPTLTQAIDDVLAANDLQEARLRLTVTVGALSDATRERQPTILIAATDFIPYPAEMYQNGVLVTLCTFRQNTADPLTGHKTTNYFSRMLALQQAQQKKAVEALWFTTAGYLAEGCISNVFLVKDGKVTTPPIETPVLAGVTRKTVCQLAKKEGIDLAEQDLTIDDLLAADEIFMTNVIMTVLPVTQMEQHQVGDGKVGPIAQKLKQAYDREVETQCGK